MKTISIDKSYGGTQGVYVHRSDSCGCDMTFAVYLPPHAAGGNCPVLWYLSGLTCTHANVMDKGEYRRLPLQLRMQEGYGHSYFFTSTFMQDHLRWHAQRLAD
ncbi:alpha/beta hydrolase-fold protein [Agrobacterium sp. MCAB5]